MAEFGGSLYSDLLRYYGVDLQDMLGSAPTLSPARVLALVENLPLESATSCFLRDTEDGVGWSVDSYLLAAAVDAVREGTFVNMQVRTKKKLPKVERLSVPGVVKESKQVNSFVKMAQAQLAKSRRQ